MKTVCLALIALLATVCASAAEPRLGKFVKYDTGDFVIVTSRGGKQAREIMQKLAKFRVSLEKVLGRTSARSGLRTYIFLVSDSEWTRYLQPRQNVAGWFQRTRFDNYMTLNGDAGEMALYIMFHEYTHYYLSSQFAGDYPPWFNEGLAELMAYAKFKDNDLILQIPAFRQREARDSDWIPFERMIKVDQRSPEYQSHKLADAFYAQAWLTVHYGMVQERSFARQFFNYLDQLNRLVPQEEAARAAFGDLAAVDAQLRAYSKSSKMFSGGLNLGELPEVTLPPPHPLSDVEAAGLLTDVMLATRMAPDRTRPLVESVQRRAPEAASSYIRTARLALLDEDPKAFDAAVVKAAGLLAEGDVVGRRELGLALLESANQFNPLTGRSDEDTDRDLKRALRSFVAAVEKDPTDPEVLWGLGTTLTRLNRDLDVADSALRGAYQRMPSSAAVAMSLANLKGVQNKPEEMIPYLNDTIRYADDLSLRRWATDTLEQMEKHLAEVKRVNEENRQQREAYEKQLAEYEKKYGKPKKKAPAKGDQK